VMYNWVDLSQQHGHHYQKTVNLTAAAAAADDDDVWKTPEHVIGHEVGFRQCSSQWEALHRAVFQAAHVLLLVSFLIPSTRRTLVFIHLTLIAGKNCVYVCPRPMLCNSSWCMCTFDYQYTHGRLRGHISRPVCLSLRLSCTGF